MWVFPNLNKRKHENSKSKFTSKRAFFVAKTADNLALQRKKWGPMDDPEMHFQQKNSTTKEHLSETIFYEYNNSTNIFHEKSYFGEYSALYSSLYSPSKVQSLSNSFSHVSRHPFETNLSVSSPETSIQSSGILDLPLSEPTLIEHNHSHVAPPNILLGGSKILMVESAWGTGKSFFIRNLVAQSQEAGATTLSISHRRTLAAKAAKELNQEHYEDIKAYDPRALAGARQLSICTDSLRHMRQAVAPQVLILDEFSQQLKHMAASKTLNDKRNETEHQLARLIKEAKHVVLADADAPETVWEYLRVLREDDVIHYRNAFKALEGKSLNLIPKKEQLLTSILRDLKAGKRLYICANSKNWIEKTLRPALKKRGIQYKAITSSNSGKESAFIENINVEVQKYQAIAMSPAGGTGLSIDAGHNFDGVYGYFSSQKECGDALDALQQLQRFRGMTEFSAYISDSKRDLTTSPQEIIRDAQGASKETRELLGSMMSPSELQVNARLLMLFGEVQAQRNRDHNSMLDAISDRWQKAGGSVVRLAQDEIAVQAGKREIKEAQTAAIEEVREAVSKAPIPEEGVKPNDLPEAERALYMARHELGIEDETTTRLVADEQVLSNLGSQLLRNKEMAGDQKKLREEIAAINGGRLEQDWDHKATSIALDAEALMIANEDMKRYAGIGVGDALFSAAFHEDSFFIQWLKTNATRIRQIKGKRINPESPNAMRYLKDLMQGMGMRFELYRRQFKGTKVLGHRVTERSHLIAALAGATFFQQSVDTLEVASRPSVVERMDTIYQHSKVAGKCLIERKGITLQHLVECEAACRQRSFRT